MKVSPVMDSYWQLRFAEQDVKTIKEAQACLNQYRVPKALQPLILREMEFCELIRLNGEVIDIINCKPVDNAVGRITRRRREIEKVLTSKSGKIFDF